MVLGWLGSHQFDAKVHVLALEEVGEQEVPYDEWPLQAD